MQWKGFKIPIIIIAFVLGLAVFWGIQKVYNQYSYERPLVNLLDENTDIITYSVDYKKPVLEVNVKFKKTDNLQKVYSDLNKKILDLAGKRKYEIILQDQTDDTLEKIQPDVMAAAYEAIDRGNYLEMKKHISSIAETEDANARIWIDQDNLYLQIEHGNNYFQEIIPRFDLNSRAQSIERRRAF
jgi:hypothetical protein